MTFFPQSIQLAKWLLWIPEVQLWDHGQKVLKILEMSPNETGVGSP